MFKIITSLLFGGDEDAHEDLKSGEVVDEGWLLVNPTEAVNEVSSVAADQDTERDDSSLCRAPSNPAVNEESDAISETDISSNTIPSIRSTASQAAALAKMTQVTRVQRAQALVDRRPLSRGYIQRQNCVCQRTPRHSFHIRSTYLHQPERRSCTQ